MLAYLETADDAAAQTCDVILASYAVHHLPLPEKRQFFRLAQRTLAPGGSLLFADIFRLDGQTRDQYLAAYSGMMRQAWAGMPPEFLTSTTEHITQRDFPETLPTILELAHGAGFRDAPQELFQDTTGFHRLLVFPRSSRT